MKRNLLVILALLSNIDLAEAKVSPKEEYLNACTLITIQMLDIMAPQYDGDKVAQMAVRECDQSQKALTSSSWSSSDVAFEAGCVDAIRINLKPEKFKQMFENMHADFCIDNPRMKKIAENSH